MLHGKPFSHNHTVDMNDSRVCVMFSWHGVDVPVSYHILLDSDMWRIVCIK